MRRLPVYRAPMRARGREVPRFAGARFGIERGVVGIGAGTGERAERMLARFAQLDEGVYVWTRTAQDEYRLGRVVGELRRDDGAGAAAVGICDVRDTHWLEHRFTPGTTPPGVTATFARGGRNLQRTHDADAEQRTASLWERFS